MRTVWMLARYEMRRGWRGAVALILLIGIVGAVVFATLAGARRTDSALDRFNAQSLSADVSLLPAIGHTSTPAEMAGLRALPTVAAATQLRALALVPRDAPPTLTLAAAHDDDGGRTIDRARLIDGRRANPNAVNEITISEPLARSLHQGVGGHLDAGSYTNDQLAAAAATGELPAQPGGPPIRFTIVGITRRPLDLGDLALQGGVVVLTQAFDRAHKNDIASFGDIIRVRTKQGQPDVASVIASSQQIFKGSGPVSTVGVQTESVGSKNAIDVLSIALRVFATVAALAGLITIAIVLAREVVVVHEDQTTLRTLGVSRVQRALVTIPRAFLVAAAGTVLAVAVAIVASPTLPRGVARRADPDIGVHADWTVLAWGIAAIVVVVMITAMLVAVISVWRSTAPTRAHRRPGVVGNTAAKLAPAPAGGLRLALEPGAGPNAVPVRSACFGAVVGVLGVVAVFVFTASLSTLRATPARYGSTWDFKASDATFNPSKSACDSKDFGLKSVRGVGDLAVVCDNDNQLSGRPVTIWGVTQLRGNVPIETVKGRAPQSANEVALGAQTMHALHKHIGDKVTGRDPQKHNVELTIVGQVALPTLVYPQPLADGALFTNQGFARVYDANSRASRTFIGRYTPGSDRAATVAQLRAIPQLGPPAFASVPVEIDRVGQVSWIPFTLAALLAVLALVSITHALVVAVRRRRRELAVYATLGFRRRQVRAMVVWQSAILTGIGLVIGIPAGLVVGRAAWRRVADGLGVSAVTSVPTLALVLGVPLALLLGVGVAFLPGRAASRVRPAENLRSE